MSYHELKERFEKLQDTEFADNCLFEDLAEDLLAKLLASERSLYLLRRNVPLEVSSFYPRITKDPVISCFKDNHLVGTQSLENPDFTRLHELGLYSLSGDDYYVRTTEQLGYVSKFLKEELAYLVGLDDYHFEINFD